MRFWSFVDKRQDDECWPWLGHTVARGDDPGYGQFSGVKGRPVYAHRYSFALHKGEIPLGKQIHHMCVNRICVNPAHLEVVDPSSHPDGVYVMRRSMTRCCKGHEYTPDNTYFRTTGQRRCRTCDREATAQRRRRAR